MNKFEIIDFTRVSVTEEEAVDLWICKVFAEKETRRKEMERIKAI